MSIQQIRRSILVLAAAAVVAAAGLFAGRLLAGAVPASGPAGRFGPPRFARIAKAHAAEIQTQLKTAQDARRSLHDAILTDPIDEGTIRARAADLSKAEGDGAILYAKVRAEIFPLLRDDQKQKIVDFRAKMRARGDRNVRSVEDFLSEGDSK